MFLHCNPFKWAPPTGTFTPRNTDRETSMKTLLGWPTSSLIWCSRLKNPIQKIQKESSIETHTEMPVYNRIPVCVESTVQGTFHTHFSPSKPSLCNSSEGKRECEIKQIVNTWILGTENLALSLALHLYFQPFLFSLSLSLFQLCRSPCLVSSLYFPRQSPLTNVSCLK